MHTQVRPGTRITVSPSCLVRPLCNMLAGGCDNKADVFVLEGNEDGMLVMFKEGRIQIATAVIRGNYLYVDNHPLRIDEVVHDAFSVFSIDVVGLAVSAY